MKNKIDFLFLKRTLILLTIAIVFSVSLIVVGWQYEDMQYEGYQKGSQSLRDTHTRYKNLVNDIDLLEQYTARYNDYKSSGLVGGERRLSWIESLESTNSILKLPKIRYNLLPQQGFDRPGFKADRSVVVKSSPMELNMTILHEEDIFSLTEVLGSSISNLFSVDGCSITLQGQVGRTFDTKKANLNANCVIRWISIDGKA